MKKLTITIALIASISFSQNLKSIDFIVKTEDLTRKKKGKRTYLNNAQTRDLMKELNYGKDYKYAHNFPDSKVEQKHFPKEIGEKKYYSLKKKQEKK